MSLPEQREKPAILNDVWRRLRGRLSGHHSTLSSTAFGDTRPRDSSSVRSSLAFCLSTFTLALAPFNSSPNSFPFSALPPFFFLPFLLLVFRSIDIARSKNFPHTRSGVKIIPTKIIIQRDVSSFRFTFHCLSTIFSK